MRSPEQDTRYEELHGLLAGHRRRDTLVPLDTLVQAEGLGFIFETPKGRPARLCPNSYQMEYDT